MLIAPQLGQLSPTLELTSTVAEIIAFFFVTLDLYGEERLTALNEIISSGLNNVLKKFRESFGSYDENPKHEFGTIRGFWVRLLAFIFALILITIVPRGHLTLSVWQIFLLLINIFVAFLVLAGVIMLGADLVCAIVAVPLYFISRLKFRGLLLMIGAALFLVSKGILVSHLVDELRAGL
jgi:hypothetical protein